MEKMIYLNCLFDLYGNLLTEKQQLYFKDYYFNNLSYGEISDKYDISRNAIYHQLQLIEEKLKNYEKKLQLYVKKQRINDIIKVIDSKRVKEELENIL